ncbi:MAG: type II secretion system F family protein [Pseudomonadota bacterium]
MEQLVENLTSAQFMIGLLSAVAAAAGVFGVVQPMFQTDKLKVRMKSVSAHREKLRKKQQEDFAKRGANLRSDSASDIAKQVVNQMKLLEIFDAEQARKKLAMAGFRGQGPVTTFMFARLAMPFVMLVAAAVYIYGINDFGLASLPKLCVTFFGFFAGYYAPGVYVSNAIGKRQQSVGLAWPDALDLLLICVESGMSIEAALHKVSEEVAPNSIELAEELALTTAELSYLQERRQAFVNLAERTGLDSVKSVVTALVQAERYGSPLGPTLRVMAAESREQRMQLAEKKAAALPPKLTVPMMIFFLPVLFGVIMGPVVIKVLETFK